MSYRVVDVEPDTPEWEGERRGSLGASDTPAVLGLSPYATRLEVFQSKMGLDRPFDPVLGFIGHASEVIIAEWVEKFSEKRGVKLDAAFMARSIEAPWLHASFDRVSYNPDGRLVTWQFKTAHFYAGHHWDEGVPLDIQAQVQQEIFVAGTMGAWVVVWIGGREFRMFWIDRDDEFIHDYLLPETHKFWYEHVETKTPPEPTVLGELAAAYPTKPGSVTQGSETVLEAVDRRSVLLSDIKAQQDEADALTLAIGKYMQDAETLMDGERRVLTFKTQSGRRSVDFDTLIAEHPDAAARVIKQGNPFKVMRLVKEKTK